MLAAALLLTQSQPNLYHEGWIDFNKNGRKDVYEDPRQPIEKRARNLLAQMTMEEKTCQLVTLYGYKRILKDDLPNPTWKTSIWKDGVGAIDEHLNGFPYNVAQREGREAKQPYLWDVGEHTLALEKVQKWFIEETRLGIPVDFTNEGIRGVENTIATCFPTQLGLGTTWNRDLIRQVGEITGREARLLGYTNVYAPILDVGRDARWGRCEEVYGEDPYLVSELGAQMVRGMQSQGIASTGKHFAVYGQNKAGREGQSRTDPQISPFEVENIHLPPWRAACAAGMMGVMSSYNDYSGVPVSGSPYWLTDRLRKEFGFQGYIVSDSEAVEYLYDKHRVALDPAGAVYLAATAGLNVRCTFRTPETYVLPLRELIASKRLPMSVVDTRVMEVLLVKFRVGLFDDPLRAKPEEARREVNSENNQRIALQASRESLVLLKNSVNRLPLEWTDYTSIAVVGPNANDPRYALSHYGPAGVEVSTVLSDLQKRFTGKVNYALGCTHKDASWPDSELIPAPLGDQEKAEMEKAVDAAKNSDLVIAVLGDMSWVTVGENKSRTELSLPGRQQMLLEALYATGKPVVLVVIAGRPMTINWANKSLDAILWAWFPGAEGGQAICDVLDGTYNPGGKLTMTFPKAVGQLPLNFPSKPSANLETGRGHYGIPMESKGWAGVQGALYPFGYGLSYTSFAYENLVVERAGTGWVAKVTVRNTGNRDGEEVAQLYIRPSVTDVTRYEQSLAGFERVSLKIGESRTVEFPLTKASFGYWAGPGKFVVPQGEYEVQVGGSCISPIKTKLRL